MYDQFYPLPVNSQLLPSDPIPLFYQVPRDILDAALSEACCELGPDFLCFETFYQAVAASAPNEMQIVDLGGYQGVQGWLFADHAAYLDVDAYDLVGRNKLGDYIPPTRCALPPNGHHLSMDAHRFLDDRPDLIEDPATLFICSAVPDSNLRSRVAALPNHVVWYPGQALDASGPGAAQIADTFAALRGTSRLGDDSYTTRLSKTVSATLTDLAHTRESDAFAR